MAASLVQLEYTYRSGTSPAPYQFATVSESSTGQISVHEIEDNYGQIVSPYTRISQSVTNDISAAMSQVENLLELTSAEAALAPNPVHEPRRRPVRRFPALSGGF